MYWLQPFKHDCLTHTVVTLINLQLSVARSLVVDRVEWPLVNFDAETRRFFILTTGAKMDKKIIITLRVTVNYAKLPE